MSVKKIALLATVAALVVAVVFGVAAVWPRKVPQEPSAGGGPGGNSCVITGSGNSCVQQILNSTDDSERLRRDLLNLGKGSPPTGPAPWQFVVLGTGDVGLKIRSDPGRAGVQIGSLREKTTAWVDCQVTNDFDPAGAGGPGPVWYRLRWPNKAPTDEFFNSQPGAPYVGWGYSQYLVPAGHDGAVPRC